MRIISLNLNKRLGNKTTARFVECWMRAQQCDIFVVQEPWAHSRSEAIRFDSYRDVGGNSKVYAWIDASLAVPRFCLLRDNWMQINLGYFLLNNVYFSAYSQDDRCEFFMALASSPPALEGHPQIVVGDFNFAPEPEDGMDGEQVSRFNSAEEREAFRKLLHCASLVDMTSLGVLGQREFTIVRNRQDRQTSFRCDLALVTDYVQESVRVRYDHSVRVGPTKFTDHSAVIIDAAVSLPEANLFSALTTSDFGICEADEPIQSHKTAMARSEPSKIAKVLVDTDTLGILGVTSILDFGCGRGRDIVFYRSRGFDADGYDPHVPFGWSTLREREYDIVTVVFVMNVIPDPWQRLRTMKSAAEHVKPGGLLFVATRSSETIRREVEAKGWSPFNDGFISHSGKRTFQKGIDHPELAAIVMKLGFTLADVKLEMGPDIGYVLARKPDPSSSFAKQS